ncbi:MAG TPA: hypothetical protein VNV41_05800 [Candidatus Acidoferrales bacterium]|nr:hypothetical protein [Candidatus Acidoferrales bacterium]
MMSGTQAPDSFNDLKGIVFTEEQLNGVKTLTTSGALPLVIAGQVFDPSKMTSIPSVEQMKALIDAWGVGSPQTGTAEALSLQIPANTGMLSGVSSPNAFQLSSPAVNGSGLPIVLPNTLQIPPSTLSGILPTTLQ